MILADIVPPAFFAQQTEWVLWALAGAAIVLLVVGADRAVGAAAKLAGALGMSKVIIGATVVSLGTTSPEAAVSVNAAIKGDADLALGNGVGSIICDTALIFGLACLIARVPKDRFVLNRHGWLKVAAGAILTLASLGLWWAAGDIHNVLMPRWMGAALLGGLVVYLYLSVRWSRRHPQMVPEEASAAMKADHKAARAVGNLLLLAGGLALVVGGSELMVGSMKEVCIRHRVPPAVIAVTFVAFGTSLPELVTAVASVLKGHADIMVGNIIGADILNVLFVIGASATAMPLHIEPVFFTFLLPTMMLVLILFRLFISADGPSFRRWHGALLLAIYVAFTAGAMALGIQK